MALVSNVEFLKICDNCIIEEVKDNKFVYDQQHHEYRNKKKLDFVYESISKRIKYKTGKTLSTKYLRARWAALRFNFIKNLSKNVTTYYHYQNLLFLLPYVKSKNLSHKLDSNKTMFSKKEDFDDILSLNAPEENCSSIDKGNDSGIEDEYAEGYINGPDIVLLDSSVDPIDLLIIYGVWNSEFLYDFNDSNFKNFKKRHETYADISCKILLETNTHFSVIDVKQRWHTIMDEYLHNQLNLSIKNFLDFLKPFDKYYLTEEYKKVAEEDLNYITEDSNSNCEDVSKSSRAELSKDLTGVEKIIISNIWFHELIFDPNNVDYNNTNKRKKVFTEISKIVGYETDITMTGPEVENKWNSMVAEFPKRQELQKYMDFYTPYSCHDITKDHSSSSNVNITNETFFDDSIDEYIITYVSQLPAIYDKSNEKYKDKSYKKELFREISTSIQSSFDIMVTADDVMARWNSLISKFQTEDRKHTYLKSGSEAKVSEEKWKFYNSMLFLKNCNGHRKEGINSFTDSSNKRPIVPENDKFSQKKRKTKSALDDTIISLGDTAKEALKLLTTNSSKKSLLNDVVEKPVGMCSKMMVINEEFQKVSEEKKILCFSEILEVIAKFARGSEK